MEAKEGKNTCLILCTAGSLFLEAWEVRFFLLFQNSVQPELRIQNSIQTLTFNTILLCTCDKLFPVTSAWIEDHAYTNEN